MIFDIIDNIVTTSVSRDQNSYQWQCSIIVTWYRQRHSYINFSSQEHQISYGSRSTPKMLRFQSVPPFIFSYSPFKSRWLTVPLTRQMRTSHCPRQTNVNSMLDWNFIFSSLLPHFCFRKKCREIVRMSHLSSLNVTVVNWTCSSENDWSLEITTRVPSSMFL